MAKENLLIIGATGWIGTYITQEILAAKESFGRIAIFTSAGTLKKKSALFEGFKRQGVEVIVGDVSKKEDFVGALEGMLPSSQLDSCWGVDMIMVLLLI